MPSLDRTNGPRQAKSPRQPSQALPDGAYLTDGKSLFRIERTVLDGPQNEVFVELEDCATLELIFCSARSISELELRTVEPKQPAAA